MDKQNPDQDKQDYEVGYGKPPKATQFKPGQSGNRKGRPQGGQNFSTTLKNELNSTVVITENGRRKKVTKRAVISKQLINKAMSGDPKATRLVLDAMRDLETANGANSVPVDTSHQSDEALIAEFLKRTDQRASVQTTPKTAAARSNGAPPSSIGDTEEQESSTGVQA